jgi:hypothetical protein
VLGIRDERRDEGLAVSVYSRHSHYTHELSVAFIPDELGVAKLGSRCRVVRL